MPQIIVNGKSYSNVDEMPEEIRKSYEQAMGVLADNNKNGIPDILEGGIGAINRLGNISPLVINSTNVVVDGKIYSSVDELPPEAREKYNQAMAKLAQRISGPSQDGGISAPAGSTSSGASPIAVVPLIETSMNASPFATGDVTLRYKVLLVIAGIVIVTLAVTLIVLGLVVVPQLLKMESLFQ